MPVKVRCSQCERVLNAPDRARGKAIRCPECGTAVRVPAAKQQPKKVAAPPPSSSMLIANLDLDRLEDTETRICPKCGSDVSFEDVECPKCHVNLETGALSEQRQAELGRKGPNPKLYYKEFFRDGWQFWKTEKRLSLRLAWFSSASAAIFSFSVLAGLWCVKPLARDFWFFIGTVALLIPPGLAWNLHTTIIDATMRKKKKLGKYNFDMFLGAALGLKLIFWFLVVTAPLQVAAIVFVVLWTRGMTPALLVAAGLEGAAVLFGTLLFPVAMVHMSMPITLKGWLVHKLSKPFFRTFPAVLYWCLFLYLTLIFPVACVAGAGYLTTKGTLDLIAKSNFNSALQSRLADIEGRGKNAELSKEDREWQGKKAYELNYLPLVWPSSLLIVGGALFGATAVFSMRTNGLYARYFMDSLDLETMTAEVKYVPKVARIDELDARPGLTWGKVIGGLGIALVLGFAFGGAGATINGKSFFVGVGWGIFTVGILTSTGGYFWLLVEAFLDSMVWFGVILVTSQSGWVFRFFMGPWGWAVSVLPPFIYGAVNWSNAKYPLVVMVTGNIFFAIGATLLVLTVGPDFLAK